MSGRVQHNSSGSTDYPRLVWADGEGNIYDQPDWGAVGRRGDEILPLERGDLIPLPRGSELFLLPGRTPLGLGSDGRIKSFPGLDPNDEGPVAVAAFLSPAHTQLLLPAYRRTEDAPVLPLFAYTAVAYMDDGFWAPAVRVDEDRRQEADVFDRKKEEEGIEDRLRTFPDNRLFQHLARCARDYCCPAARNLFHGRWEAPLPTSPECNAECIGCISWQPSGCCPATQPRIDFVPTPEEIAEVALDHFRRDPDGIASFGQGCEGEPLMVPEVIEKSVMLIREETGRGTLNLNTNGSRPDVVERLAAAGLDAIRVSLNSARQDIYQAYFKPSGYGFEEVVETIRTARRAGLFTSLNYLVFPGVTGQQEEMEALAGLIGDTGLDMIQWRNLNIDPDLYLESVPVSGNSLGIGRAMAAVRERFPDIRHGYFNPPMNPR
jgi:pyruvate-formate lyase-activating enzyme